MASAPARAGCALSDPIPSALAENDEQYAVATCTDADGDGTVDIASECDTCEHRWTDTKDPLSACQPILDTPGRWGMGFHEKTYRVETFRAGDDGPQGP